jgi:hypothetical protein
VLTAIESELVIGEPEVERDLNNEFVGFSSIPRLSREILISEKLDGTNAQILFNEDDTFQVGSRNRWITPDDDNFGFARWVYENVDALKAELGYGRHFGEWWGSGIQRGYGLKEKRFSLFNVKRWEGVVLSLCHVVPVLWRGMMDTAKIDEVLEQLQNEGSVAAPGFMNPEGVVVYHKASGQLFKKTLDKNDGHKGVI